MKKNCFVIVSSLFLVSVAEASPMTSSDLKQYEQHLGYLECKQSGGYNCTGSNSTEQSRDIIISLKNKDAQGMMKSKKAELDSKAGEALLKITKEEAEQYVNQIKDMGASEIYNEMAEECTLTTTMQMPSTEYLEHGKSARVKYTTGTFVQSKKDVYNSLKSQGKEADYKPKSPYLEQMENKKQEEVNNKYTLEENGNLVKVFSEIKKEDKAIGEVQRMTSEMHLRRYPGNNYDIKIAKSTTDVKVEELEDVAKTKVIMDTDLATLDPTDVDQRWIDKYKEERDAVIDQGMKDSRIGLLEMTTSKAQAFYSKMLDAKDDSKKEYYKKEFTGFKKHADGYYREVSKYDDYRAKQACKNYREFLGSLEF